MLGVGSVIRKRERGTTILKLVVLDQRGRCKQRHLLIVNGLMFIITVTPVQPVCLCSNGQRMIIILKYGNVMGMINNLE